VIRRSLAMSLVLGAAGLAACGGGGSTAKGAGVGGGGGSAGGDGGGGGAAQCFDYTGFDGGSPVVQFSTDVLPIFRSSCGVSSSCHGAATPPSAPQHFLGPPISGGTVTAAEVKAILGGIVNQPAVEEEDMDVIKAGDPQHSYLLQKVDGLGCPTLQCAAAGECGAPMPLGGTPLSENARDMIRRWVAQGAMND
jgi:hypothetical protein